MYARWTTGGMGDPAGYKIFTSISELKTWLASQPDNTEETPYKVGLKSVNLDADNNWGDLGVAVKSEKYVDLNLQGCTGTIIPDGYVKVQNSTIVYYGVFSGCYRLLSINLPSGLKTIGKYAFYWCSRLGPFVLPEGLTNINSNAFGYCGTGSATAFSMTLPEGLKTIEGDAFAHSGLISVTIPGSIKDLSTGAFMYSKSLVSVIIKEGVESIGKDAFVECPLTSSVNLPVSLKTIHERAFWYCSFETITIPQGVTSIGENAFAYNRKITEVVMLPATPPSLPMASMSQTYQDLNHILYGSSLNLKAIKVPAASLNAYKTANVWSRYANIIVANTN